MTLVRLAGDEHLNDDERWVRRHLESVLGPTRVADWKGAPPGQHDLEADLPDGGIAAIEITSEADRARLSAAAAARRHLSAVTIRGSQFAWLVEVTPEVDARALRKSADLVTLIVDMERQGQSSLTTMSDYRNPWRARLEALGIQSVHGFAVSSSPRGAVYVVSASFAAWGWVTATADRWITGFLATDLGKSKLAKLGRANAAERHLAILIHPDTDAGLGIAVADELPSVVPPSPLTHLWLMAPTEPPRAFRWTDSSGWSLVGL